MNFFQNIGFAFGKNDRNYIENEISKTNNVNDIKKLIEKSNPEIIDYYLLNLAVSKGYEISANTPVPKHIDLSSINNYIQNTNNPNFVKFIIENSIQYIEYDTLYLAIQHSYKPSKDILEKFLKSRESRFQYMYYYDNSWFDKSKIYGELPLIIESLDDSNISYDILRLATRLGYKVSDKTPILKFTTTEELKEFVNSYVPIMYSQVQDSRLSEKEKFFLDNERSHFYQIIKKIIAGNSDLLTYEIFDLAEEKNLILSTPPFNTTPNVLDSKEETREILNNAKSLATIYALVDNSNEKVMDAELFQEAIEHGYSIHYNTPKYVFEDEQYRSFVEEEKNNLLINPNKRLWNISPYLMNEVILENCYKNGDKITEYTPSAYRQPKYIKYAIRKRQVDAINFLDASNVTEKELFDILHLAIQYGYEYSKNSPAFLRNPKLIEYAIEKGQANAINYLNFDELKDEERQLEELLYKTIENGYHYYKDSPEFLRSPKLIKYAIEKGEVNAINYLNFDELKDEEGQLEELLYKTIENGYQYSYSTPTFLRSPKLIKYAIEKGEVNAINYLNFDELKDEEGQLEELVDKAIENGYRYSDYTPEFLRSLKIIKYVMDRGQEDVLYYVNIDSVTDKNIDIFYKCLKTYSTKCCIREFVYFINKLNRLSFADIGIVFNKEQLVAVEYLKNYPFLINCYQGETLDSFYKKAIENKNLCNELFAIGKWKELSELVAGNDELIEVLSKNQMKIISIYIKTDTKIQSAFQDYIINNMDTVNAMTDEKLNLIAVVLKRLSYSNSSEMQRLSTGLATQLLHLDNPIEALDKIEDVFLKNNLPTVGKIYKVFGILHPNFQGFDFSQNSSISPILLSKSNSSREIIIFADLIKSFMGSNNRNFKNYLENLEQGNNIFLDLCNHKIEFEDLDKETIGNLKEFVAHLNTLYNNTKKGENDSRVLTGNIITDIEELRKLFSPNGNLVYDLPDRIIKMYCHFAGIDTLEQAKTYMKNVIEKANERNIEASASYLKLEQGDFVKGIGDITYLSNILQNGSVAREFLGASADSDSTPLDTDLSMIFRSSNSVGDAISQTAAAGYGPIWLVLKNRDNKFNITRRSPKEDNQEIDTKTTSSKLEAFYTGKIGADHYGIRTGFASSEIDYIVTKEYDDRIGFEIARNGFYIPVADETGKIIFTPDDYKKLRNKMQGLSYYDTSEYELSDDLETPEIIETSELLEKSRQEVEIKRQAIQGVIKKAIGRLDLELKEKVDGNLQEGYVELIDTGSTGRGTNLPGDGDFDYMMRLDKSIILDSATLSELKQELLKEFHVDNTDGVIDTGDFRLKQVMIEGLNTPIDIDITFTEKTDQLNYSTEMCLKDRLDSIKKQYPDKYNLVIANIIEAKKILKHAGAYKPDRGETPQGGLGGVGVENWILQNGGSLKQAAIAFSKASNGKSFEEFKKEYKIFDFGENHLSLRKGYYPYDNFVYHNMSESGYEKMKACLDSYSLEMKPVEEHSKHSK